ncbi:hypothetical protein E4V01_25340 [Methylorubrum sp. Q1]|nr:hypothetical protein E4V01_25340 [Methylorubrum sp. Q1]
MATWPSSASSLRRGRRTSRCWKRLWPTWSAYARRTARLDRIVHHLGLALGGRPTASVAQ